jgi:hypothetical protein
MEMIFTEIYQLYTKVPFLHTLAKWVIFDTPQTQYLCGFQKFAKKTCTLVERKITMSSSLFVLTKYFWSGGEYERVKVSIRIKEGAPKDISRM